MILRKNTWFPNLTTIMLSWAWDRLILDLITPWSRQPRWGAPVNNLHLITPKFAEISIDFLHIDYSNFLFKSKMRINERYVIPAECLWEAWNDWSISGRIVVQLKQRGSDQLVVTWDSEHCCLQIQNTGSQETSWQLRRDKWYWNEANCNQNLKSQLEPTRKYWAQKWNWEWHHKFILDNDAN